MERVLNPVVVVVHRHPASPKVMEGVQPKRAAMVRLAFQAVDPDCTGCADAEVTKDKEQ